MNKKTIPWIQTAKMVFYCQTAAFTLRERVHIKLKSVFALTPRFPTVASGALFPQDVLIGHVPKEKHLASYIHKAGCHQCTTQN